MRHIFPQAHVLTGIHTETAIVILIHCLAPNTGQTQNKKIKAKPTVLENAIAVPAEANSAIKLMDSAPKGAEPIHVAKTPITRDRSSGSGSFNTRVDCIAPKAAIPTLAPNNASSAAL